jgi:hypothetical protein
LVVAVGGVSSLLGGSGEVEELFSGSHKGRGSRVCRLGKGE